MKFIIYGERMNFINCGYYVVEPVSKPSYISLCCKQVLTISNCICNHHPSLDGSFWDNHENDQKEYQKLLKLTDKEFFSMKEKIRKLFYECKLDFDSRFAELSDVLPFFKNYLYHLPDVKIISIALEDIYKDAFSDELKSTPNILSQLHNIQAGGQLLGYEILGWDYSGFHSYLCNGLDKNILEKYTLKTDCFGIIQNPYAQVKEFANYITGKGEPVLWLPFAIYEHTSK